MSDAYLPTLHELQQLGICFACIGTYGLYLRDELPADYVLHDVDLVIEADEVMIRKACDYLQQYNWQLLIWNEPIQQLPVLPVLLEKFYLRAKKEALTLDLIFGGMLISNADLLARAEMIKGIPVACSQDILTLKRNRNSEIDRQITALGEKGNDRAKSNHKR